MTKLNLLHEHCCYFNIIYAAITESGTQKEGAPIAVVKNYVHNLSKYARPWSKAASFMCIKESLK
jgi:hypothetical protein